MLQIVRNLEPQQWLNAEVMINELDEAGQIIFVHKGKIGVGYELNKIKKVVAQFINKCVIGSFYVTFKKRSNFLYITIGEVDTCFIRRHIWIQIIDECENI